MRSRGFLLAIVLLVSVACGGGGGEEASTDGGVTSSGGGSSTLTIVFTPDQPTPGPNTVSMSEQSASGNTATVAVNITDTNDVYGAAFDVTFDASVLELRGWSPGTVLETGGHTVNYIVDQPVSGRLVIAVSRVGSVPTIDVTGTQPLIRLDFRATAAGNSNVAFQNGALLDNQPADLPGITWEGGSTAAN